MNKLLNDRVLISSIIIVFGLASLGWATTYYVDFENGNDANDGLSAQSAWRHIPGTRLDSTYQSGYVTSNYGNGTIVSGLKRVPAGTIFKLKSGSTQSWSIGGSIYISSDFYENGPGNMTGEWYTLDENGHLHSDGHSVNALLGYSARFTDEANHSYVPLGDSDLIGRGYNLSQKPWYVPEMGIDRNGNERTNWTIGPYEFQGTSETPPSRPQNLRMR